MTLAALFPLVGPGEIPPCWSGICWRMPERDAARCAPLGVNVLARLARVVWLGCAFPFRGLAGYEEADHWRRRCAHAERELGVACDQLGPDYAVAETPNGRELVLVCPGGLRRPAEWR